MEYETIICEKKDSITYITFSRPSVLNALDETMIRELYDVAGVIGEDDHTRVVILTGAGRAFVSGGDISLLEKGTSAPYSFYLLHDKLMRFLLRLEALPQPVIAAINGFALGGGLEIATACDIRIAAENARLGVPEVGLGIMPGAGGTARLPRIIGKGKAMELALTGDRITAQEALALGLVNRVVPEGEALQAAEELARKIIANAPQAVRQIKNAIQLSMEMDLEGASEYCQKNCMMLFATKDGKEGLSSFLEKRKPVWSGE